MRLILTLEALKDHVYDNNYNHNVQSFIYNLIKNTEFHHLHDSKDKSSTNEIITPFCFSNIFPYVQTRIATIAKMFMEKPENGIRIAVSNLKADYILIYVVAQRTQLPRGGSFYTLGYGGDESKTFGFIRIGGFDEQKYINQDRYTPIFWNSTLIGKLIPFKPEGYTLFRNGQPTTALFQDYKPGAFTVYSQYIKYPENGTNSREQPLSLVYSSPSFLSNNSGIISAVLIYKVNYDSYFQNP